MLLPLVFMTVLQLLKSEARRPKSTRGPRNDKCMFILNVDRFFSAAARDIIIIDKVLFGSSPGIWYTELGRFKVLNSAENLYQQHYENFSFILASSCFFIAQISWWVYFLAADTILSIITSLPCLSPKASARCDGLFSKKIGFKYIHFIWVNYFYVWETPEISRRKK